MIIIMVVVRHSEGEYDHDIMGLGNGAVRP